MIPRLQNPHSKWSETKFTTPYSGGLHTGAGTDREEARGVLAGLLTWLRGLVTWVNAYLCQQPWS